MTFFNVRKGNFDEPKSAENERIERWSFSRYEEIFQDAEADGHFSLERLDRDGSPYSDIRFSLLRVYQGKYHFVVFNAEGPRGDRPRIISAHRSDEKEARRLLGKKSDAPALGHRRVKTVPMRGCAVFPSLYSKVVMSNER